MHSPFYRALLVSGCALTFLGLAACSDETTTEIEDADAVGLDDGATTGTGMDDGMSGAAPGAGTLTFSANGDSVDADADGRFERAATETERATRSAAGAVEHGARGAADATSDAVREGADEVGDAASEAGRAVERNARGAADAASDAVREGADEVGDAASEAARGVGSAIEDATDGSNRDDGDG